jgi:hypothetical protein
VINIVFLSAVNGHIFVYFYFYRSGGMRPTDVVLSVQMGPLYEPRMTDKRVER